MRFKTLALGVTTGAALLAAAPVAPSYASSHMDAPLITYDDPANTTDVYAFVSEDEDGYETLTTALAVYPFEEPGIGTSDDDSWTMSHMRSVSACLLGHSARVRPGQYGLMSSSASS